MKHQIQQVVVRLNIGVEGLSYWGSGFGLSRCQETYLSRQRALKLSPEDALIPRVLG